MPESHEEVPQATVSEVLAQGPYVAARAGFEPVTVRTKGVEFTNVLHLLVLFVGFLYVNL